MKAAIGPASMGQQNVQLSGMITGAILASAASVMVIAQLRKAYADGLVDGVAGRLRWRGGSGPGDDRCDGGYADGFADGQSTDQPAT